jgi:hypothetical protein
MDNKHQHLATSFVLNRVLESHNIFGPNFQSHSLRKTINAATFNVKLKMVLTYFGKHQKDNQLVLNNYKLIDACTIRNLT